MPSRFVSIFKLSIVKLSTPVARTPKCPPSRIEKSRSSTLWQFFNAIALFPAPGVSALGFSLSIPPRLQPLPPDQSSPNNRKITNPLPPDQTIAPMIVTIILIALPRVVRLRRIIPRGRPRQRSIRRQISSPPAPGTAQYCSSTGSSSSHKPPLENKPFHHLISRSLNRLIYRWRINRLPIRHRTKLPHIKHPAARSILRRTLHLRSRPNSAGTAKPVNPTPANFKKSRRIASIVLHLS